MTAVTALGVGTREHSAPQLVQGTLAHRSFLAGHREVTVRSCPSLEAQALEGGAALEASGSVWAGLLGAPVNQSLGVGREYETGRLVLLRPRDEPLPAVAPSNPLISKKTCLQVG